MDVELQVNNSAAPEARYVSWAPSSMPGSRDQPDRRHLAQVNMTITGRVGRQRRRGRFPREHHGSVFQQPDAVGPDHWRLGPVLRRGPVRATQRQGRRRDNRSPRRRDTRRLGAGDGAHPEERQHADDGERDRFVSALAQLNNQGPGRFADFRDMHTSVSLPRLTARRGFCPGTALTCSISNASSRRSMQASRCRTGVSTGPRRTSSRATSSASPNAIGTVQFSATNPLQFW